MTDSEDGYADPLEVLKRLAWETGGEIPDRENMARLNREGREPDHYDPESQFCAGEGRFFCNGLKVEAVESSATPRKTDSWP